MITDGTLIAAALVAGATIGASCAAFLSREGRLNDRAAGELAICRAEDLAGKLLTAEEALARANAKLQQFAEEDAGLDMEPAA